MYVCTYVCIYGPSFPGLGLGGLVGPKDSLYKVSYKSKYGSKALDQESLGDEIKSKVILGGVEGLWVGLFGSISVYQGPNGSIL